MTRNLYSHCFLTRCEPSRSHSQHHHYMVLRQLRSLARLQTQLFSSSRANPLCKIPATAELVKVVQLNLFLSCLHFLHLPDHSNHLRFLTDCTTIHWIYVSYTRSTSAPFHVRIDPKPSPTSPFRDTSCSHIIPSNSTQLLCTHRSLFIHLFISPPLH
jgi:hypothetical protein